MMKSKLLLFILSLFLLSGCGSDDDNLRRSNPELDYTEGLDGDYEGTYTGTYTEAPGQNFGESAFATVRVLTRDEVEIDMQQSNRFRATLGDPQAAPSFLEISQGRGRFTGATEISGRIDPVDSKMNFVITGNYAQGGTYEISFEGTLID